MWIYVVTDLPGMECIQEEHPQGEVGKRRKMELTINSPTSSIMKLPFSPTASPLSSPLSSPTKSGRAKKTISFLLPDNQRPSGSAAAEKEEKEETKEKLEEKAEMKEKEENGEDEVETKSISEENRRRPVYEYPDLHVSASGYRFYLDHTYIFQNE